MLPFLFLNYKKALKLKIVSIFEQVYSFIIDKNAKIDIIGSTIF